MTQPKKFNAIVIDSVNSLLSDEVVKTFSESGKLKFDEWKDYAIIYLNFINKLKHLQKNGDLLICPVLGYEGSGKTISASNLNPETTYYVNSDNKPLTFSLDIVKKYKAGKLSEGSNYNRNINDYDKLMELIEIIYNKYKSDEGIVIYLIGHLEDFRSTDPISGKEILRQRTRIPGKMAHKYNIDGSYSLCLISYVDENKEWNDPDKYKLIVHSKNGVTTSRSPLGIWDDFEIPNNLKMVQEKLIEYIKIQKN